MITKDTVVIGAGLTGLTTACYLNKAGKDFIVLEKQDRIGGVINTVKENNFVYEEGPNTGVIGNADVVDLFDKIKDYCSLEVACENAKKRYVLKNSKWKPLPMNPFSAISTPLFTLKDKFNILAEPFRKPGTNSHETLAQMVKRRLGQSFLDYAIDPFILGVYAGDPNILVPKYALPKLYNLEQNYGSFIGGSIKKKFEKKDEQQKKVSRKVFSATDGLSSFTEALYKEANVENFMLGADNITVQKENEIYKISANCKGEIVEINAKNVITTVGAFALPDLLPFVDKSDIKQITSLHYTKVVEVVLGFDNWEGMKLDGFGGLIPHKENRDILGILFMSSLFKKRAPENGALLSIFMGGMRNEKLVDLRDNEIKKIIEKEVSELLQIKSFNPDLFKFKKHKAAIPQYSADSGQRFETIEKLQNQYKGLIIAGNLRDGIGMADRIKQGKELANSVGKS